MSGTTRIPVQSFERLVFLAVAVIMGDTESCSSRAVDFAPTFSRNLSLKVVKYNQVLRRLRDLGVAETSLPGFEDELWAHFHRLPARFHQTLTLLSFVRSLVELSNSPFSQLVINFFFYVCELNCGFQEWIYMSTVLILWSTYNQSWCLWI